MDLGIVHQYCPLKHLESKEFNKYFMKINIMLKYIECIEESFSDALKRNRKARRNINRLNLIVYVAEIYITIYQLYIVIYILQVHLLEFLTEKVHLHKFICFCHNPNQP